MDAGLHERRSIPSRPIFERESARPSWQALRQAAADDRGRLLARPGAAARLGRRSRPRPATGRSTRPISTSAGIADGELNLPVNCLDRHLAERGDKVAIIFEGDEPGDGRTLTYRELHDRSLPLRQSAQARGRRARRPGDDLHADDPRGGGGDARLRADRRGPFGRASAASRPRASPAGSPIAARASSITADEGVRGGKRIPLKANVDAALRHAGDAIERVIVVTRTGADVPMKRRPRRLLLGGRARRAFARLPGRGR